ncbi:Dps family protein [[Kitasatospora] papulosa]|uniref:Dps family protein n=1 Tax=[Kitasatospora] papulosa TaxID=1464011 RepID=UPI0036D06D6F
MSSYSSQVTLHQQSPVIQEFGTVKPISLGLTSATRGYVCRRLSGVLADTQVLYAMYKKFHWLTRGATFCSLDLLMDKHSGEQLELIDELAERMQTLGGVAVGDPRHTAELTRIRRPANGVEKTSAMLSRLREAHETILVDARDTATRAGEGGDGGTSDLLVSKVIRVNEIQCWFLTQHPANSFPVGAEPVEGPRTAEV